MPLLINQFGTERRMCLALGVERARRRRASGSPSVLELHAAAGPAGQGARARPAEVARRLAGRRSCAAAPCQEVVIDPPDLDLLPIMTCWPDDGGPFITLPGVITARPGHGRAQRRHVPAAEALQPHARAALADPQGRRGRLAAGSAGRMEVAIALGTDPVTAYAGSAPLPKHIDELMMAGFLRGEPVELVQCKTVDLQVPAHAEIVIEGYCERGVLEPEGPFGDHTGYYTPREPFPLLHVTAMTMRRDPIYPSIVVGVPPAEDVWLGKATERIFLPAVRLTNPEVVDYDLPVAGAFHNCCIVSIRKALPRPRAQGHARDLGHGPAVADEVRGGRRRLGRRARLRPGRVAARRQRRPRPRRRALQRPARPARPRAEPAEPRRQDRLRRDAPSGRARATSAAGRRSRACPPRSARRSTRAGRASGSRCPARGTGAAMKARRGGLPSSVLLSHSMRRKPAWLVRSGASLTPGDPTAENAAG